ncbi:hypothetical protein AGABI2DRAFT_137665 [Agaricus bisporus var. bisporus H97]|uniref:hypothetical protein n=1 Tax=Agaricus bisporus var. bisporus (strain H97 / ATCC MYA-4626 / FGSC 10389) TaxID=936046 RepID=UPI00029F7DCE|nr:hypothetical protein AGABI2DRAFT_137665 [Agaricus bisporus var. bisporus H97]EKV45050.1 hypothetical protein AGABI2DRAFT_137665 [Agaricus bisporus var. bisporus H97]
MRGAAKHLVNTRKQDVFKKALWRETNRSEMAVIALRYNSTLISSSVFSKCPSPGQESVMLSQPVPGPTFR